jgi:hypothetical protein
MLEYENRSKGKQTVKEKHNFVGAEQNYFSDLRYRLNLQFQLPMNRIQPD